MKRPTKQNLFTFCTIIILILGTNISFGQNNTAIASCCKEEVGRCTGSSYCTACTNCSRCKYCNNGGSCGVCSSKRRKAYTRPTTRDNYYYPSSSSGSTSNANGNNKIKTDIRNGNNTLYSNDSYYLADDLYSEYYLKTLIVNTKALNLRKGPGTNYQIIEKLSKYQELVFLAITGDWIKVRVKSTNTIGFVHYKYVLFL